MSGSPSLALLVCLGLLGCPQTPSSSDSSTSGSTGGSTGSTGDGPTGSTGTGSTGTGSTGTGSTSAGTTGSTHFTFSEQGLPLGTGIVTGISGRSDADVYAVTSDGWVLHGSGATWVRVYRTSSNLGLASVFAGSDGKVWVGGEGGFLVCSQHCSDADAAPFVAVDLQGTYCRSLAALCGRDATVYALCDQQGSGALLLAAAGGWTSQPITAAYVLDKCFALPDGKVLVTAQSKVYRFDPSLGISADDIQFPPGARPEYAYFSAVWGDASHQFVSTNGGRIFSWSPTDHIWVPALRTSALSAYAPDGFRVIVGTDSSADVLALGLANDTPPAALWDGTTWSDLVDFGGGGYSYFSGWSAATDDLWLGGAGQGSSDGFIVHAHR
jgi:hypothetical protein